MARKIAVIQQQILDSVQADSTLSQLNSPSQVAIYRLWAYIQAVAISLLEQIIDVFKTDIEDQLSKSIPGTPAWLRDQILKFQYSSTTAQAAVVNPDFTIGYPSVNKELRIISRCSVSQDANNIVNVKVATGEPPAQLSTLQVNSLKGYIDVIGFAGVQVNVINEVADKLYVAAKVYYDAQYSATIQASVIAALNNYLTTLSSSQNFNGTVKVSAIEDAIQGVIGVKDVKIIQTKARRDGVPLGSATVFDVFYPTYAGYIVEETTSGNTFADTITYLSGVEEES